jgi:precorrin-3B synthase
MNTVSHQPEIKGWCPGALRPMMSGDGLVVRVRLRGGRLSPEQAKGIADLAAQYGNGLIDLSARANVQVRGLSDKTHGPMVDGLRGLGLIDMSAEAEARRNIVVTPFWQHGDGTSELVRALTDALALSDGPQTPGKFGYAVDCGPVPVLQSVSADIRIERGNGGGLIVRADGSDYGAGVTMETAAATALELARWFMDAGGSSDGRGRMAALLARGVTLPERFATTGAIRPTNNQPAPGPSAQGFLVSFPFGQMHASTLSDLSAFGFLRVTPWRMMLIEGAAKAPEISNLITDPHDSLLRVVACTGAPGCPQALGATRPFAAALAARLPQGTLAHVSGCTKGCAHPSAAALTLVARRSGTFDLIHDGKASDLPERTGLLPENLVSTPDLLTELSNAP